MKIAYVSYEYPPDTAYGGIATYVQQAAKLMESKGHNVEVFSASAVRCGRYADENVGLNLVKETSRSEFASAIVGPFLQRHAECHFDVVECPENHAEGRYILETLPDVAHVVKLHTPHELLDEIMAERPNLKGWIRHHRRQARMFLGALRRARMPLSFKRYCPEKKQHVQLYEIEKCYAQRADFVVSSSLSLEKWAAHKWSLEPSRLITVPNPYIPSRSMLKIPVGGNTRKIGFLGRLEQRKGINDFIEAVPTILGNEPGAKICIIGKPVFSLAHSEMFDEYVKRRLMRFGDAIELMKPCRLEELPARYSAVDICVFPSIWENFANICLEAMAAGRAIVASSAGGMAEMLEEGKHGLLVPPRDPQAIAASVIRLLRSPQERQEYGASARGRVLQAYGPEQIGPRLEQSYKLAMSFNRSRN